MQSLYSAATTDWAINSRVEQSRRKTRLRNRPCVKSCTWWKGWIRGTFLRKGEKKIKAKYILDLTQDLTYVTPSKDRTHYSGLINLKCVFSKVVVAITVTL